MGKKQIFSGLVISALFVAGGLNPTYFFRDLPASAINVNTSSYGDINDDGKVNVMDISCIQNYMNGTKTLNTRERIYADLNADEKIDADDIQIISYIYTALNSDYVSECKSAWYKKYSSRTYGSLTFDYLDDGTVSITGIDKSVSRVTVPEKINGFVVSTISNASYCPNLKSISLPSTLTKISSNAFMSSGLTSVVIPDNVNFIGYQAFGFCKDLKSVILPENLTEIGNSAFIATALTSVVIPDNVKIIGDCAFQECELTSVKFGKNVTELGALAFRSNPKLTSLELPDSLKIIGAQSLFTEGKFDNITIPENVEIIESNQGFETIYSDTIKIENPNCTIEEGALNVDVIRGYLGSTAETYANKHNIEFVSLTKKTYAGIEYTMYKDHAEVTACNSNAETVSIMSSVEGIPVTKIADSGLVNGNFKSIILPSSITELCARAFWNCSNVTNIALSDNIKTIGVAAFTNCDSLKTITLPEKLKEIKQHAFWSCESLESITIPESVEKIEQSAFFMCKSLSEVKILNKNCVLEENSATIPKWAIIYGYRNSTANNYADKYGNTFISLDPVMSGDINEDGKVNIADAVILNKWLLCVPNTKIDNWEIVDLCEDGKIDIFDMVEMRKLIVKK